MRTYNERLAYGCELLEEDDVDERSDTPMGMGMSHVEGYPTRLERPRSRTKQFKNKSRRNRLLSEDPHCHYCNCDVDENNSSIDHKQPRSKGGDNSEDNTVLACKHCNGLKGDLTYEEYQELRDQGVSGSIPRS